jgi:hypothetical protein
VHRHVEGPHRDGSALDLGERDGKTAGEMNSSGGNPQQKQTVGPLVAFQQLMGDPDQGPRDLPGLENYMITALIRRLY